MPKLLCTVITLFTFFALNAQYKNDNVLFKTVYPQDLSTQLKLNPGYLLLDVRSKGEYADTSSMASTNLGHLKNAKNIDVQELASHLNDLQDYKNKPIFVYCSYSQRSRRASQMLADSGFTKVYNINGGMTTLIQTRGAVNGLYETTNKYTILSPAEFCQELNNKNSFILDIRSDSAYRGISTSITVNAMGTILNAHHIASDQLSNSLQSLPQNKKIILVDDYGDKSAEAATMLSSKGFTNIAILFDGLFNFENTNSADVSCKNSVWLHDTKFKLISPEEFDQLIKHDPQLSILDVRNPDEFANKAKNAWRNQGHIKNAINISAPDLFKRWDELLSSKNKPIVIYSFSSDMAGYNAASTLIDNGFTKVYLLSGGIWNIRWRANNIKGKLALIDMVTDVPAEYL